MKILLYTVLVITVTAVIGIISSRWGDKRSECESKKDQEKTQADK